MYCEQISTVENVFIVAKIPYNFNLLLYLHIFPRDMNF
jgi:hypothetical protein